MIVKRTILAISLIKKKKKTTSINININKSIGINIKRLKHLVDQ